MAGLEGFLDGQGLLEGRPYITFLGGEPLQSSTREVVVELLDEGRRRGYAFHVITNGYLLDTFIPSLVRNRTAVKFVQVTLDGPPDVHDARRPLRGEGSSFSRIADNVDLALDAELPVQLRTNVDRGNLGMLPELGRLITERGWHAYSNFKAYLAPTEDTTCRGLPDIPREDELLAAWLPLRCARTGELAVFDDSKLFRVTAMLHAALSGQARQVLPRFSYCGATKGKAFVFGPEGRIYQCVRGVGDERTSVGTYFPQFQVELPRVRHWMARDITTMGCSSCAAVATC
jgi:uncharacterized protein